MDFVIFKITKEMYTYYVMLSNTEALAGYAAPELNIKF